MSVQTASHPGILYYIVPDDDGGLHLESSACRRPMSYHVFFTLEAATALRTCQQLSSE